MYLSPPCSVTPEKMYIISYALCWLLSVMHDTLLLEDSYQLEWSPHPHPPSPRPPQSIVPNTMPDTQTTMMSTPSHPTNPHYLGQGSCDVVVRIWLPDATPSRSPTSTHHASSNSRHKVIATLAVGMWQVGFAFNRHAINCRLIKSVQNAFTKYT